jgi:hypothetical protein
MGRFGIEPLTALQLMIGPTVITDSYIRPGCQRFGNSLFFLEKFRVRAQKFPVPLSREFCSKALKSLDPQYV